MSSPPVQRRFAVIEPADWLEAHGDYLFSYAMTRVRRADVAEELVQETLLAALGQRAAFESRSSLRTWLTGILKHKIVDHLQAMNRRTAAQAPTIEASAETSDERLAEWVNEQFTARGKWKVPPARWTNDASVEAERTELGKALADCLEKLPAQSAEVFLLTERMESSADQLSKVLGLTATNIGVILHRARMALRRCLETNWFGHSRSRKP
jgi:RNA polymerase sigma-70 factor (ECF subfamily)